MFGENKYVGDSAIHLHDKLHKRHTAIFFIKSRGLLHIIWLNFTMYLDEITQLISYQIIGATPRDRDFCSHCYFGGEIPWTC